MHVSYPSKLPLTLLRGKSGFFRKKQIIIMTKEELLAAAAALIQKEERTEEVMTVEEFCDHISTQATKMLQKLNSIEAKPLEEFEMSILGGKPFKAYRFGTWRGAEVLISQKNLLAGKAEKASVDAFFKTNPKPIDGKIWLR